VEGQCLQVETDRCRTVVDLERMLTGYNKGNIYDTEILYFLISTGPS